MKYVRTAILCLSVALTAVVADAAVVQRDLLAGTGDFERSVYTRWFALYSSPDYDYSKNPKTIYRAVSGSVVNGYNMCSANDTVAVGWSRVTEAGVNPESNVRCSIVDGVGVNGSRAQLISLKGMTGGAGLVSIDNHLPINNSLPYAIHAGDKITFAIDSIRMVDYSGLPTGSIVHFSAMMCFSNGVNVAATLDPSPTSYSRSVSATVPSGAADVSIRIKLVTNGDLGAKEPGIYIDGAHVYIQSSGSSTNETWEIPAPRTGAIKSHIVHFNGDLYKASNMFDEITMDAASYSKVGMFRYLRPNAGLYVYYSGSHAAESRDKAGNDHPMGASPITVKEAVTDHPEWLYSGGTGINGFVADASYPDRYPLKINNPDYQSLWVQRIVERAKLFGVDGVWLDDLVSLTAMTNENGKIVSPYRSPMEVQQFLHAVVPILHANGLKVIQNASSHNIGRPVVGRNMSVYFDPFWVPDSTYTEGAGYTPNTPNNTPDVWFHEYGFFYYPNGTNLYDKSYWLLCLNDMDTLKTWNTAVDSATGQPKLTTAQKKSIHVYIKGAHSTSDPAYGINGWVQFGLCSYLLAQNDWTYCGWDIVNGNGTDPDLSFTKLLGVPYGTHQAYNGDQYLRYRLYKPSQSSEYGGVVVVNAWTDASKTYTLPFNAVDEYGSSVPSGTTVTLKPHTGRVFLRDTKAVSVRVGVPSSTVTPGQELTVTVEYSNISGAEVTNFVLRAQVPDQTAYVAGSAEANGGRFDSASNSAEWSLLSLPAGASGVKTFKARVK